MVIHDFHLLRVATEPDEANPPLVVDAHAVLTGTAAFESLQSVTRRRKQIAQRPSRYLTDATLVQPFCFFEATTDSNTATHLAPSRKSGWTGLSVAMALMKSHTVWMNVCS
jgi:hypothetical protein